MDIQGFELHALRGAKRVLTDNPNIKLLLEFWPYGLRQAGVSGEELLAYLTEKGFTAQLVCNSSACKRINTNTSDPASYFSIFARRA